MVNKKSPLKQGLLMAIVMFVISLAWQTYKLGEFNEFVVFASFVGGVIGGLVYGGISYFRQKF